MPPPRKKRKTNVSDVSLSVLQPPAGRVSRAALQSLNRPKPDVDDDALPHAHRSARPPPNTTSIGKRTERIPSLNLSDLCVELEIMIFSYLDSHDLLNLSRTCKDIRGFLTNRRATERLWAQARINSGNLPPRPPFMSEPAFIHLLYSPYCHVCGCSNVRQVYTYWFIRACSNCIHEITIPHRRARDEAVNQLGGSTVLDTLFRFNRLGWYWTLIQAPYPSTRAQRRDAARDEYRLLRAHVTNAVKEFLALPRPVTKDDKKQFMEKRRSESSIRRRHSWALNEWLRGREEERLAVLEGARKQRFEEILKLLREEGWEKELNLMGPEGIEAMSKLPVVRQSSRLTAGAWPKVREAMDKTLQDTRAKVLDIELRAAYRVRLDVLQEAIVAHYVTLPRRAHMDCRPRATDLALMPDFRAIIEVPPSDTVTIEQFSAIMPKVAAEWDQDIKRKLTESIRPLLGEIAPGVDPLDLAIAVFPDDRRCAKGVGGRRYPGIISHECVFECYRSLSVSGLGRDRFNEAKPDAYTCRIASLNWNRSEAGLSCHGNTNEFSKMVLQVPFNLGHLCEGKAASAVVATMREIVCALGLDPSKATFDDLEACNVWLRCVTCEREDPKKAIQAFSWRAAYTHHFRYHSRGYKLDPERRKEWRQVDEIDMAKINAILEKELSEEPVGGPWACALCTSFNSYVEEMKEHLKESHGLEDLVQARRDGTIYPHPSEEGYDSPYARRVQLHDAIYPLAWGQARPHEKSNATTYSQYDTSEFT